jgi:hypothetical protein
MFVFNARKFRKLADRNVRRAAELDVLYDQIRLAREALDGYITWEQAHPPEAAP